MSQVLLSEETVTQLLHILNNMPEVKMGFDKVIISSYELAADLSAELKSAHDYLHVTWSVEDVIGRHRENQGVPEDWEDTDLPEDFKDITIEQARLIIKRMDDENDATVGITWETIDYYIEILEDIEREASEETVQLVLCNNCQTTFIDTNPKDQPYFTVKIGTIHELPNDVRDVETNEIIKGCPTCKTDGYLQDVVTSEMITYKS